MQEGQTACIVRPLQGRNIISVCGYKLLDPFGVNTEAVGIRCGRVRPPLNFPEPCDLYPASYSVNQMCKQSISQLGFKPGAFGRHYHAAVGNVEQLLNAYRV